MQWSTTIELKQTFRPRFWWIYIANCYPINRTNNETFGTWKYKVHFTQNNYSIWNREIGINERFLNSVYIIFWFIYVLLFIIEVRYYKKMMNETHNKNLSQIMKLLILSLFLQIIGLTFICINYINLSLKGKNIQGIQIIGNIFSNGSYSLFLLLLMMLAQGWMISRNKLIKKWLLFIFIVITFLCECAFYIWRLIYWYEYETQTYFYNSPPQWYAFI